MNRFFLLSIISIISVISIIPIVSAVSTDMDDNYEGDHYIIHCNVIGAKVWISGEYFGEIPESHYLDAYYKEYWIKPFLVVKKNGYEEYWEQLEPALPGIPEHIEAYLDSQNPKELGYGSVRFESKPDNAEIYIKRHGTTFTEWERIGRTEMTAYYLPAIPYDVVIQKEGYKYQWKKVFVSEGTTIDEYFILEKLEDGEEWDYFKITVEPTITPESTIEPIIIPELNNTQVNTSFINETVNITITVNPTSIPQSEIIESDDDSLLGGVIIGGVVMVSLIISIFWFIYRDDF